MENKKMIKDNELENVSGGIIPQKDDTLNATVADKTNLNASLLEKNDVLYHPSVEDTVAMVNNGVKQQDGFAAKGNIFHKIRESLKRRI